MALKIDFLFYCPEIEKNRALDETESLHAVKVLRKKQGDQIQVTDGKGGWFSCEITHPHPKSCEVKILKSEYDFNKPDREIYIAICPTKNTDRIEYFLEKATEIGISGVFFLKTQNTYPKKINSERLEKIVVSAMKQSLKAYKPTLSAYLTFAELLKQTDEIQHRYIAHLQDDAQDIIDIPVTQKMLVLIGPEGDFSNEELLEATNNEFKNITLGKSRLRTETAGVFAVSVLNAKK